MDIIHRTIRTNGIDMHVAEAGEEPLVLLLRGFPEPWYSYRHQLGALAEAGYRAVPQRGYGATDAPPAVHDSTLMHLAGDIVGLFHALNEDSAVVVGQDWGSPVATTLFRPDLVRGLVMLSTPYFPRADPDFLSELTAKLGSDNYQVFFHEPGVAEAALDVDFYPAEFSRTGYRGGLNWYRNLNWPGTRALVDTLGDLKSGPRHPSHTR